MMLQADSPESLDLRRPRTESRHPSCAITEAVTQSRSSARSPKAFDAAADDPKPQLFDFRISTALYDYNWDQDSSRSQTYGTNRDSSDFQENPTKSRRQTVSHGSKRAQPGSPPSMRKNRYLSDKRPRRSAVTRSHKAMPTKARAKDPRKLWRQSYEMWILENYNPKDTSLMVCPGLNSNARNPMLAT